jgi:hypothetical protein
MTTYYVNYAAGSDTNSGTSASSPWQHAPGDKNATGNVKKADLVGGDEVLFKGGVVYQGSIAVPASGTPGKPIVYEGTGWGTGQAILSGLTSVQATFTPYPGNSSLSVATLPAGMTPSLADVVEINGKVALMSNDSASTNPNFPELGLISYSASEMKGSGSSWTFTDATLGATLSTASPSIISNLVFQAYVAGNNVRNMTVTGYNPSSNALSLSGSFGMPGHPSYLLYNDPAFVSASNPYPEYAVEGNQIIAAVTPGVHTVSVSTSPFALRATNKSNVTFDGFNISGYGAKNGGDGRGIEVFGGNNIQITNNTVSNLATPIGYGYSAIGASRANNVTISGNTIGPNITYGAGIDASNGTNVVVTNNTINSPGWTGIDACDDINSSISSNRISNTLGVHATGIIAFDIGTKLKGNQESQNVSITNNQIENGDGGIAIEGDLTQSGPAAQPNNFTIAYNVITNQGGHGGWGIMDWGNVNTENVYGNIVLMNPGAYGALALATSSENVSYYDNILQGYDWNSKETATFSNNVALSPKNVPPGVNNTVNTSLASILQQALASPGLLASSIGSILRPTNPGAIGIDYTTGKSSISGGASAQLTAIIAADGPSSLGVAPAAIPTSLEVVLSAVSLASSNAQVGHGVS